MSASKRVLVFPANIRTKTSEQQAAAAAVAAISAGRFTSSSASTLKLSNSNNMRPASSVSGDSGMDEKPKRKRQRLDHLTQDEKILRRKMKNRMAAQTARDRKKLKMNDLEGEVTKLVHNNEQLVKQNNALRNRLTTVTEENERLRAKLLALGQPDNESTLSPAEDFMDMIDELQDDIDLNIDDLMQPLMLETESDVGSDDSGCLFSSDHSGSNATTGNGCLVETVDDGPLSMMSDLSSKMASTVESAEFINVPQQKEQVPDNQEDESQSLSVDNHNSQNDSYRNLQSLVRIAERELANFNSAITTTTTTTTTNNNNNINSSLKALAAVSSTTSSTATQPMAQTSRMSQTKISYNGRLKTFLIILHLLSLKGMLPRSSRTSSKSRMKTALLRAFEQHQQQYREPQQQRQQLLPSNQDSLILESLLKTSQENVNNSVCSLLDTIQQPRSSSNNNNSQQPNIILERFLHAAIERQTMDNVQTNDT